MKNKTLASEKVCEKEKEGLPTTYSIIGKVNSEKEKGSIRHGAMPMWAYLMKPISGIPVNNIDSHPKTKA